MGCVQVLISPWIPAVVLVLLTVECVAAVWLLDGLSNPAGLGFLICIVLQNLFLGLGVVWRVQAQPLLLESV